MQLAKTVETIFAIYLTDQRSEWEARTTIRKIACLRGFGRWLFEKDNFLKQYRAPTPAPHDPTPIVGGISAVMVLANAAKTPRHAALVALCGLLGLRISEARSITPASFSQRPTGWTLTVRGKGDKTRILPVHPEVMRFLHPAIEKAQMGAGGGFLVPIGDRGARAYLKRHGLTELGENVSSHDFRATFATESYAKTKDLAATQDFMGHADINTTRGYTKVAQEAMERAGDFFS